MNRVSPYPNPYDDSPLKWMKRVEEIRKELREEYEQSLKETGEEIENEIENAIEKAENEGMR